MNSPNPPEAMPGEGVQAFPRLWFEEIGGYDLAFEGWGFEDSDLRERGKWSIGITLVPTALLIHQWHPQTITPDEARKNRAHYERMKQTRQLVRNGGVLARATAQGNCHRARVPACGRRPQSRHGPTSCRRDPVDERPPVPGSRARCSGWIGWRLSPTFTTSASA